MLKEQWKKTRTYLTFLINKTKKEESHNDVDEEKASQSTTIELEPTIYEELKELANLENTTVSAILYRAIEYYKAGNVIEEEWKIDLERKEKNPLLLLDGIAVSLDQNQEKKQDKGEPVHESRNTVNW